MFKYLPRGTFQTGDRRRPDAIIATVHRRGHIRSTQSFVVVAAAYSLLLHSTTVIIHHHHEILALDPPRHGGPPRGPIA